MSIESLEEKLKKLKPIDNSSQEVMSYRNPAQAMEMAPIDVDGVLSKPVQSNSELSLAQSPTVSRGGGTDANSPSTVKLFPTHQPTVNPQMKVPAHEWFASQRNPASTEGYDDLESRIRALKSDDKSGMIDLIAMGLSTGIGAMFGQTGAGAKVAGQYGVKRASDREKRDFDLEKAIISLRQKRAADLAKSNKAPAMTWRDRVYVDDSGNTRMMKYVDPSNGFYTPSDEDFIIQSKDPRLMAIQNPDGSTTQLMAKGNSAYQIGGQNAPHSLLTDAEGRLRAYNPRTIGQQGSEQAKLLNGDINLTSMGMSKRDTEAWEKANQRFRSDTILRDAERANSSAREGLNALAKGDIGGATVAIKRTASALEDGKLVSDNDFKQVSQVNLGILQNLVNRLDRAKDGQVPDSVRRELHSMLSSILAGTENTYNRRVSGLNEDLRKIMGESMREDLLFPSLTKYTPEEQGGAVRRAMDIQQTTNSSGEYTDYLRDASGNEILRDGKRVRVLFRIIPDPRTGEMRRVIVREVK